MSRKKKVFLGVALVVVVVAALSGYVAFQIVGDLRAARATLTGETSELTGDDLAAAIGHLEDVSEVLDGPAAKSLGLVPVVGQNLRALDSVVASSIPALEDAERLRTRIDEVEGAGLIDEGRVQIQRLDRLREPLARQTASLRDLRASLEDHMNGWLLPPLWNALDTLLTKTDDLQRSADRAEIAVDLTSTMLGGEDRTFLVLLLNNAELRGAGGILSAVGTLRISDGELTLGDFDYYGDLAAQAGRRKTVDAPADIRRRFGRYLADTTLWVNTSVSPDVPEVAITARNLYEVTTGVRTDGAIVLGARGLAELLPEGATVRVPGSDIEIPQSDLAEFMYSDSYEVFADAGTQRREALLNLGPRIFELFLSQDLRRDGLDRLSDAIAGEHIRIVSFEPEEQAALTSLGISGELTSNAADTSLITVQNLGADKLDFWMERRVEHGCRLSDQGVARCQTRVGLRNRAPRGLPRYVTQDKEPYALYEGFIEVYVPEDARVTSYRIDGEDSEYFRESEDGRRSLAGYISVRPDDRGTVEVSYELAFPDDLYTLEVSPQPLTRDADVRIVIVSPEDWTIETPDGQSGSVVEFKGVLDRTLRFRAEAEDRPGLSGLWDRIASFWNDPVF
ncbi:MAG: DUF4012 domain-containing protein [Actinomycetota bacterium]